VEWLRQSKWFLFDDESVEPVEDLNAPLIYDEDDDPVLGGKKKPVKKKVAVGAKGKGFVRDENGQVCVALHCFSAFCRSPEDELTSVKPCSLPKSKDAC